MPTSDTQEPQGEKIVCVCGGCIAFCMQDAIDQGWTDRRAQHIEQRGATVEPLFIGDRMDGCKCKEVIPRLRAEVEALRAKAAEELEGRWVSVSERLPEMKGTAKGVWQSVHVLVYTDRATQPEYRISKAFLCKVGDASPAWKSAGLGGNVTHWMQLPSPPTT